MSALVSCPMAAVVAGVRIENARVIERRWQRATDDYQRRALRREYWSEVYDVAAIVRSLETGEDEEP